jgi:hypothetical protein
MAPGELVQEPLERTELVGPPHELPGKQPHTLAFFPESRPVDPGGAQGRMAREAQG